MKKNLKLTILWVKIYNEILERKAKFHFQKMLPNASKKYFELHGVVSLSCPRPVIQEAKPLGNTIWRQCFCQSFYNRLVLVAWKLSWLTWQWWGRTCWRCCPQGPGCCHPPAVWGPTQSLPLFHFCTFSIYYFNRTGMFKGTVSPIYNWLKVVDQPWWK